MTPKLSYNDELTPNCPHDKLTPNCPQDEVLLNRASDASCVQKFHQLSRRPPQPHFSAQKCFEHSHVRVTIERKRLYPVYWSGATNRAELARPVLVRKSRKLPTLLAICFRGNPVSCSP